MGRLIYIQLLRDHNWGSRPALPGLSRFSRLASFNGTFALWKPLTWGRPIVSTSTKDKANCQNNAAQSWVSTCFLTYCFKLFISRYRSLSLRWVHDVLQGGECSVARRKGHGCVSKSFNPNIRLSTLQNQLHMKILNSGFRTKSSLNARLCAEMTTVVLDSNAGEIKDCHWKEETLPKALRTQALTALTSNFGLLRLVWFVRLCSSKLAG